MNELKKSMKAVASFQIKNTSSSESTRLCLFPGHFDTSEIVANTTTSNAPVLSYANPEAIKAAGYDCVQVADDYNAANSVNKAGGKYPILITHKPGKSRYRDFLNLIRFSSLKVTKIRIIDLLKDSAHDIFGQELEVSESAVGAKNGSDFIQLSQHIDPSNYLQSFIDIDLNEHNLLLDETTLAFLEIPAGAHFQIDFTLA